MKFQRGWSCLTLLVALAMLVGSGVLANGQATTPKPTYDFSMSQQEKIALAESAAPSEVSGKSTVYSLEKTGYVKVRDGSNGFTCFVVRTTPWSSEPTCFDAQGAQTIVQVRLFVEQERVKGKNEDEIESEVREGYKSGRFKVPSKTGIVYMLSSQTYIPIGNEIVHARPHVMFYAPYATSDLIGSPPEAAKYPRVINPGEPDAYILVMPMQEPKSEGATQTQTKPKL
jgi:hypothetical protein